jgi:hypothetical protein
MSDWLLIVHLKRTIASSGTRRRKHGQETLPFPLSVGLNHSQIKSHRTINDDCLVSGASRHINKPTGHQRQDNERKKRRKTVPEMTDDSAGSSGFGSFLKELIPGILIGAFAGGAIFGVKNQSLARPAKPAKVSHSSPKPSTWTTS